MAAAELFRIRALVPHLALDFVDVIEIVGQRSVNAGESNGGHVGDDLVGSHALMLMPYYDIEHTHTMAGDASLTTAHVGRPGDPVLADRGHDSSISDHFGARGSFALHFCA